VGTIQAVVPAVDPAHPGAPVLTLDLELHLPTGEVVTNHDESRVT
jgi:hypothetical protein